MMGNTKTLNIIRGKDKIKCVPNHVMAVYQTKRKLTILPGFMLLLSNLTRMTNRQRWALPRGVFAPSVAVCFGTTMMSSLTYVHHRFTSSYRRIANWLTHNHGHLLSGSTPSLHLSTSLTLSHPSPSRLHSSVSSVTRVLSTSLYPQGLKCMTTMALVIALR